MKLIKAEIKNYRLLHDAIITFDKDATAIVGKNNSGKTSLSCIFNIFLHDPAPNFVFDDFSLISHSDFMKAYQSYMTVTAENKEEVLSDIQKKIPKIQLFLTIEYDEKDNWSNMQPFFTSLEDSDQLVILCEYAPESTENFLKNLQLAMQDVTYSEEELINKIKLIYQNYYKTKIRPHSESESSESVSRADIHKLIQTKFINAQRVLDDSNSDSCSKLSQIFENQFQIETDSEDEKTKELLEALEIASKSIDGRLETFFLPFIAYFKTFGFPGLGKEKVVLKSQLGPETLFKRNVKLFYTHEGKSLPEKYNGLGYSNLIYIIAQIIGFYNEIRDKKNNLNLIFIEEPEAHMHPQMQSVFIKNITSFLKSVKLDAQVVITTHSPHILAASDFEAIRYFTPIPDKSMAIIKDMMDFNKKLERKEIGEFLQQYLTLGKCELFFADKAIMFEGTVERILLPIFINKLEKQDPALKLSEQYISSIEIGGAYIDKFKELLEFLGLKTLIITDIDAVRADSGKTEVKKGQGLLTSNVTLKDWIPGKDKIDDLLDKTVSKKSANGMIWVAYQKNINPEEEAVKCGRSFEEAFVIDNCGYIFTQKDKLLSIKHHLKDYKDGAEICTQSFVVQEYIDKNRKKTEFAFDLLDVSQDSWIVPGYIKEGLTWLAK